MIAAFQATVRKPLAWRDPLAVANGLRDRDGLDWMPSDDVVVSDCSVYG